MNDKEKVLQFTHCIATIAGLMDDMERRINDLRDKLKEDPDQIVFGMELPNRIAEVIYWQTKLRSVFTQYQYIPYKKED